MSRFGRSQNEFLAKKERMYIQMKRRDNIGFISNLVDKLRDFAETLRIEAEIRRAERESKKYK